MDIVTIDILPCESSMLLVVGEVSADFRMVPPDDADEEDAVEDTDVDEADDDTDDVVEDEPGELAVVVAVAAAAAAGPWPTSRGWPSMPAAEVGDDDERVVVGVVDVDEATEEAPLLAGDDEIELLGLRAATRFATGDPADDSILSGCCCCDCCCCWFWFCFLCFLYLTLYML